MTVTEVPLQATQTGLSRGLLIGSLLAVSLWLVGCGSVPAPVKPKPKSTSVAFSATADLNPDRSGRPSPLLVRVFILSDPAPFLEATYDELTSSADAVLGATMLTEQRATLRPGLQSSVEIVIPPNSRAVGVVAEFADILTARWKDEYVADLSLQKSLKRGPLRVSASRNAVGVTAGKNKD